MAAAAQLPRLVSGRRAGRLMLAPSRAGCLTFRAPCTSCWCHVRATLKFPCDPGDRRGLALLCFPVPGVCPGTTGLGTAILHVQAAPRLRTRKRPPRPLCQVPPPHAQVSPGPNCPAKPSRFPGRAGASYRAADEEKRQTMPKPPGVACGNEGRATGPDGRAPHFPKRSLGHFY